MPFRIIVIPLMPVTTRAAAALRSQIDEEAALFAKPIVTNKTKTT